MSRFSVRWMCEIRSASETDHADALSKVGADADARLQQIGERWTVSADDAARTVTVELTTHVDNLDAAG